jgi:hypothetical protein
VSFPGLKPWAVFCSPVGRLELAQENVQTLVQALRAWLLSCCPSGTNAIRPSRRLTIILALEPPNWFPSREIPGQSFRSAGGGHQLAVLAQQSIWAEEQRDGTLESVLSWAKPRVCSVMP